MSVEGVSSALPGARTVGAALILNILERRQRAHISCASSVGFGFLNATCAIDHTAMGTRRDPLPPIQLLGLYVIYVRRTLKPHLVISPKITWTKHLGFVHVGV